MRLLEDTARIPLFGTEVYAFGLYCAIGAACAITALVIICRYLKIRALSALLTGLLGLLLGAFFSRLLYCLLNFELGEMMPVSSWHQITTGGWTMGGMVGGVMLAAWAGSRITKEKPLRMLDAVSAALPLMIAAERLGESRIEGFDVSRPFRDGFRFIGFLTVTDELESRVATFRLAAILAIILFLILIFLLARRDRRDGDILILFMMLCGAGAVVLESLRDDHHLEYSFVHFQQILAAVMWIWSVILAGRRAGRGSIRLFVITIVCMLAAVGICIAIEFAFDRTVISHVLLYMIMIAALSVPIVLGLVLLSRSRQKPPAEQKEYGQA